jgi:hypothetical protein
MQMFVQQQATVVTIGVLYIGDWVDFVDVLMFGAEKCTGHCEEWNSNLSVLCAAAYRL